jgi:hypothetical protein
LRSGGCIIGEDSIDDASGVVRGVAMTDGEPSEALLPMVILPALEVVDDLLRGNISGAL